MSQAQDLLNNLSRGSNVVEVSTEMVNDIIMIDPQTRNIIVPSTEILFGVETDNNVERKYFKCPRIVGDNIDLSTLSLRIHYKNAEGFTNRYFVRDVEVVDEYITFSWKLDSDVLVAKGTVYFTVCAYNGNDEREWNTTLASGNVLEGLDLYNETDNGEYDLTEVEEEYARDVLQELLNTLDSSADSAIAEVIQAGNEQITAIERAGAEQIEAIRRTDVGGGDTDDPQDPVSDPVELPYVIANQNGVLTTDTNGSTNTINLQKLIDDLNADGGGTIYIPAGTYKFASASDSHGTANHCIRVKSNVNIVGDGTNTILKPVGHTTNGLDMFFFNDYVEKSTANYIENCKFENFVIDGAETTCNSYTSSGKGFMINLFKDCYWKNVVVKNTLATGFGVDCPINSAMEDCYAENCGTKASANDVGASGFGIGYGYSPDENFFMSNCIANNNKKFGIFFEHQNRFDSTYKATNNDGFIVTDCKADGNYVNFGGIKAINVQYKNCFSKQADQHGYMFENSDNCHALGCYSVMEGNTSFVILSDTDPYSSSVQDVKDISFNQCISKYTEYGAKVVHDGTTSAKMQRNMIKDCFFDATITNAIQTSGTMDSLIIFGNVSTGADNDFHANVTEFVNENNSWNDSVSSGGSVEVELPYAGQKLIAFGTSDVSRCDNVWEDNQWKDKYNGGYLAYLVEHCGFDSYTNEGVAGIPTMHMGDGSGGYTNGISDNVAEKLSTIENHDVIQIHCAGNDYLLEAPLGCIDSDNNATFAGALKEILERLQELQVTQVTKGKKPIEIFVTLPTKSKRNNDALGEDPGKYHEDYVNIVGHKEIDYVDMCIKICNKYGVTVIDTYRNSGISPVNASVYLEDDGSHMNSKGYEVFGQTIAGVMKSHHGAVLSYDDTEVEDYVMINGIRYDLSNVVGYEYKMVLNLGGTPYLYTSHAPMYFHNVGNGKYAEAFVMYYTARASKDGNNNSFEPLEILTTTQTPIHLQTLRLNTTGYYAWPGTNRDLEGLIIAANHDIKLWGSDEVLYYKNWNTNQSLINDVLNALPTWQGGSY